MEARRAHDFAETGTYLVATGDGIKKMYRDPQTQLWNEDLPSPHAFSIQDYFRDFLGATKAEALAKLEKLYGPPIGPQRKGRRR